MTNAIDILDLTVERNPEGAWVISTFVIDTRAFGGPFRHREIYYFYSKREAVNLFAQSLKDKGYELWEDDGE